MVYALLGGLYLHSEYCVWYYKQCALVLLHFGGDVQIYYLLVR